MCKIFTPTRGLLFRIKSSLAIWATRNKAYSSLNFKESGFGSGHWCLSLGDLCSSGNPAGQLMIKVKLQFRWQSGIIWNSSWTNFCTDDGGWCTSWFAVQKVELWGGPKGFMRREIMWMVLQSVVGWSSFSTIRRKLMQKSQIRVVRSVLCLGWSTSRVVHFDLGKECWANHGHAFLFWTFLSWMEHGKKRFCHVELKFEPIA